MMVVVLALASGPWSASPVWAHGILASSCFGSLRVSPSTARIGSHVELIGSDFTCKSPKGRPLKTAAVFLYQPNKAFYIFDVRLKSDGKYSDRVVIPRQLVAASSLYAGHQKRVNTKPGLYYLGIQVAVLALPPINQALTRIRLVR